MRTLALLTFVVIFFATQLPAFCGNESGPFGDTTAPAMNSGQSPTNANTAAHAEPPTDEPEFEYDDKITITVTPLFTGPVVDRVSEPAIVTVSSPGASSIELYLEPVDAPYGGRIKGEPRLLGKASTPDRTGRFAIKWVSGEPHRYVRLYALSFQPGGRVVRSRGVDLGMGGSRQLPEPAPQTAERKQPQPQDR